MAAQAATPAIGASRDGASVTPRALELPRPAATAAAPVQAVLPTSREASAPEGPAVTASLSPAAPPSRPAASPAPQSSIGGAVKTDAAAATDCLPDPLRAVLADVAARFGGVAVVSTHKLNTTNHSAGSIRATLHHDCKAVDIRPDRTRIEEIKTYLRTRREVNGIESYRNGIIHIDVSGTAIAASRPRGRQARTQASAETGAVDAVQAAPPQPAAAPLAAAPPSPFTPVVPERYR
jgi:hypothetical protein